MVFNQSLLRLLPTVNTTDTTATATTVTATTATAADNCKRLILRRALRAIEQNVFSIVLAAAVQNGQETTMVFVLDVLKQHVRL